MKLKQNNLSGGTFYKLCFALWGLSLKRHAYHFFLVKAGFSIRIKVGGRNVEVGGEGVTRATGATL